MVPIILFADLMVLCTLSLPCLVADPDCDGCRQDRLDNCRVEDGQQPPGQVELLKVPFRSSFDLFFQSFMPLLAKITKNWRQGLL